MQFDTDLHSMVLYKGEGPYNSTVKHYVSQIEMMPRMPMLL